MAMDEDLNMQHNRMVQCAMVAKSGIIDYTALFRSRRAEQGACGFDLTRPALNALYVAVSIISSVNFSPSLGRWLDSLYQTTNKAVRS